MRTNTSRTTRLPPYAERCVCGCERGMHTIWFQACGVMVAARCIRHSKLVGYAPKDRCRRFQRAPGVVSQNATPSRPPPNRRQRPRCAA